MSAPPDKIKFKIIGNKATFKPEGNNVEYVGLVFTFTIQSEDKLAFCMNNASTSEAGWLLLGIMESENTMLALCEIEKRDGYDFCLMKNIKAGDKELKMGVYKVSQNYQSDLWGGKKPDMIYFDSKQGFHTRRSVLTTNSTEKYKRYSVDGQKIITSFPYESEYQSALAKSKLETATATAATATETAVANTQTLSLTPGFNASVATPTGNLDKSEEASLSAKPAAKK